MIWAIGDIHGMFDSLKEMINQIRIFETMDEPVEKIIFIGDYIDHGPSSKEVIDLIGRLEYPTTLLAGNHEDLALRLIHQDKKFLNTQGNIWHINGAMKTYRSIFDHRDSAAFLSELAERAERWGTRGGADAILNSYKRAKLPRKYENFLNNLKYSAHESFDIDGKEISFTFLHALPCDAAPVKEQRTESREDFNGLLEKILKKRMEKWLQERANPPSERDIGRAYCSILEYSHLWRRDYESIYRGGTEEKPIVGYQGEVIVHGHTPTLYYSKYYHESRIRKFPTQFKIYAPDDYLPFVFSRTPESGYLGAFSPLGDRWGGESDDSFGPYSGERECPRYLCGEKWGAEAINIDTGAVYGGALTALGLSVRYLRDGLTPVLTVKSGGNARESEDKIQARIVKIDHFGGPREIVYQTEKNIDPWEGFF
ncbi:MAG: metallophosphoesterase [Deltaproteobacteria bacterium]|jgi:hypothetical protein|nr:metallophosphoesterase [Deltaproteobacteria bacterium]